MGLDSGVRDKLLHGLPHQESKWVALHLELGDPAVIYFNILLRSKKPSKFTTEGGAGSLGYVQEQPKTTVVIPLLVEILIKITIK